MRVTNNMIMSNTKININGNKTNVNTLNNQMTSQKKISRPSDDPVIAIRALRLRSKMCIRDRAEPCRIISATGREETLK